MQESPGIYWYFLKNPGKVLELMKQMSQKIRKRILESPGFSINFENFPWKKKKIAGFFCFTKKKFSFSMFNWMNQNSWKTIRILYHILPNNYFNFFVINSVDLKIELWNFENTYIICIWCLIYYQLNQYIYTYIHID